MRMPLTMFTYKIGSLFLTVILLVLFLFYLLPSIKRYLQRKKKEKEQAKKYFINLMNSVDPKKEIDKISIIISKSDFNNKSKINILNDIIKYFRKEIEKENQSGVYRTKSQNNIKFLELISYIKQKISKQIKKND